MCVDAENILKAANELEPQIIADRRELHSHPEVGKCLPRTKEFVKRRLCEIGYEPQEICESGIVATVGNGGKCVLLRADMDALRIDEKTELEFRSTDGSMHACGHDMHTAMLLGAAEILMKNKDKLGGTVKLVFQPDEEGFTGAKTMLKSGVLNSPEPDIGFALHVNSGTPSGMLLCGRGVFMAGCTLFRITVSGKGCHGAMPETGVDPINIAAHIHLALQEIVSREVGAKTPAVVTVGKFTAGEAPNIIPQTAVLEGTIRTFDRELSAKIFERIGEISRSTAEMFRGTASVTEISSAPPLVNDAELVNTTAGYAKELFGDEAVVVLDGGGMGSEDFASYTYEFPCAYLLIGAGTKEENSLFGQPMHNEKVVFDENILAKGAALHAYVALKYLNKD